jgi:hypothetical protein
MVVLIVEGGNTMTQFHEGQEVEVMRDGWSDGSLKTHGRQWCKATIVSFNGSDIWAPDEWHVEFPDGTRAVFDTDQIKEIAP